MLERAPPKPRSPAGRLENERARTVGQILLFADLIEEGSWVDARIDRALPDRKPQPRPDPRRMLVALGPVAVFGASNFPLAFSVPGGDTVSALAAGCPVVVKAHPAHPGTSELAAEAIRRAARDTRMPEGVFGMVHGASPEVGITLVTHPAIRAAGFTGSLRAGRTLFDAAAMRPEPIPVYAEMGSSNPVFLLPGALAERSQAIARGLASSVTLGSGQFCTNPGLAILLDSADSSAFLQTVGTLLRRAAARWSTPYQDGVRSRPRRGHRVPAFPSPPLAGQRPFIPRRRFTRPSADRREAFVQIPRAFGRFMARDSGRAMRRPERCCKPRGRPSTAPDGHDPWH